MGGRKRRCQLAWGSKYHPTAPSPGVGCSLLFPAPPRYNIGKLRQQESNLELQLVALSTPGESEAAAHVGTVGSQTGTHR